MEVEGGRLPTADWMLKLQILIFRRLSVCACTSLPLNWGKCLAWVTAPGCPGMQEGQEALHPALVQPMTTPGAHPCWQAGSDPGLKDPVGVVWVKIPIEGGLTGLGHHTHKTCESAGSPSCVTTHRGGRADKPESPQSSVGCGD